MSYFEIGIMNPKTSHNIGTLWRSAYQLGASGIFMIGARYKKQASDTYKAYRHLPLRQFSDFESFYDSIPYDCKLVGIEMGGQVLGQFSHPKRCIYLLGAEDNGLSQEILSRCHEVVSLEAIQQPSYNVAVSGSIVMYDRCHLNGKTNVR